MEQRKVENCGFWKKLVISGSGISSKRMAAVVCVTFSMVLAMFGLFLGETGKIDSTISTVIIEFLTAGVAMFGVTALEKRRKDDSNT